MTSAGPDNIDSNYQSIYVNNPIINVNNNSCKIMNYLE